MTNKTILVVLSAQRVNVNCCAAVLQYLDTTIQQMSEAWEDILLEMDSKLIKFAEQKAVIITFAFVKVNF